MARRPWVLAALLAILGLVAGAALYAQMESGDRGILPLDSSNTLEVQNIHVDVGGKDAETARLAGWRIAQREAFRRLWAQSHGISAAQAPTVSDSTLDDLVSSIVVDREQIGPNRYIADLGILFDRARASQLLGIGGVTERSHPMLLIPVTVTAGTEMSVELRNAWQRAWAEFRTAQSPIDYVRISGLGPDPLLVNAAQTARPGRGAWRNLLDFYGADDILVAKVLYHRLYPGGPVKARFVGSHGPDGEPVGSFALTGANLQAVMNEGAKRMDQLFAQAFAAGHLTRDSSLNLPPPPPPPPSEETEISAPPATVQVQVVSPNAITYNYALAHLRTIPGVDRVDQVNIAIGGLSNFQVTYRGSPDSLRSILAARGWGADVSGRTIKLYAKPVQAQPAPQPQPQQPQSPPANANSVQAAPAGNPAK
jgi:hypothetical protein